MEEITFPSDDQLDVEIAKLYKNFAGRPGNSSIFPGRDAADATLLGVLSARRTMLATVAASNAIEQQVAAFKTSSDSLATRMLALTIVIAGLTVVLVLIAIF